MFDRSKQWVVNCRRADLSSKTATYLNTNCRLCQTHFEDSQFMNDATKKSLVWNAVPTVFNEIPNPPKLLMSTKPPPKKRALSTGQQGRGAICKGTLIIII